VKQERLLYTKCAAVDDRSITAAKRTLRTAGRRLNENYYVVLEAFS
jgi:hypothetical protein